MSVDIKNVISILWSVDDPVYPYMNTVYLTEEEAQNIDFVLLKESQLSEYDSWLNSMKEAEQKSNG